MSTIGVAIAVPEPYAAELQGHRAAFGDAEAASIPTHVTLVPPTDVGDALGVVTRHLGAVACRHAPFGMRLRGTATFRPISPVVFVSVTEGISACELLADDIRRGPLEQRYPFPYHPHVTIAHHIDDAALDVAYETLADYDASFEVESFKLYKHCDDGVWRTVSSFALSADI
ncbi:MAG: 2'-5' RNA ligase family protein [Nocardioidaceae bacterium]|nr:2'-5' RNA ligase family protein [Nocardioidaceae bacterium]